MTLSQIDAFALTLILESVAAAMLARAFQVSPATAALCAILGSWITHPILWWIFHPAQSLFGTLTTPLLEVAVFLAESLAYRFAMTLPWSRSILLSFLVNAVSWGAGEIIYRWL